MPQQVYYYACIYTSKKIKPQYRITFYPDITLPLNIWASPLDESIFALFTKLINKTFIYIFKG